MTEKSKEIMKKYVAACDRYEEEKRNSVINPKAGSLHTFNQCLTLRSELVKAALEENGYAGRKFF